MDEIKPGSYYAPWCGICIAYFVLFLLSIGVKIRPRKVTYRKPAADKR